MVKAPRREKGSGMSKKVMIVDDDTAILSNMTDLCKNLGLDVESFDKFELAVNYLKGVDNLDCLITDYHLGDHKGNELIVLFQKRFPEKLAVLVSGYGLTSILEEETAMDAREIAFFEKPVVPEELTACLKVELDL